MLRRSLRVLAKGISHHGAGKPTRYVHCIRPHARLTVSAFRNRMIQSRQFCSVPSEVIDADEPKKQDASKGFQENGFISLYNLKLMCH